jgi:hypothetical protein
VPDPVAVFPPAQVAVQEKDPPAVSGSGCVHGAPHEKPAPLIVPLKETAWPCESVAVSASDAPPRHHPPLPPDGQFTAAPAVSVSGLGGT